MRDSPWLPAQHPGQEGLMHRVFSGAEQTHWAAKERHKESTHNSELDFR